MHSGDALLTSSVQEVILDMFFDLLNIRAPDWHQAFIAGRRLTSMSDTMLMLVADAELPV